MTEATDKDKTELRRALGISDATLMGLGSILGTGVFVSIAIAAGIAGANVVFCIVLAGLVAMCNAFSSAQLAAATPVSGGTYEYGYRYLHPYAGFVAGWLFMAAKSASAATAALGFAGYLSAYFHLPGYSIIPLALAACFALTLLIKKGIKKSSFINITIVSFTIISLLYFIIAGSSYAFNNGKSYLTFYIPMNFGSIGNFLNATALMFVAYTGYGRIATMSEEVVEPRLTIPVSILSSLIISSLIYIGVAIVAVGIAGSEFLSTTTEKNIAPLESIAEGFTYGHARQIIAFGAITAMLGVLLNLILGLSRVLLAMSRRGDMPESLSEINNTSSSPEKAVITVGIIICIIIFVGNVKTTWSFSAFTVLIYYAITNLAAIRMPRHKRLYPVHFSYAGLIGCMGLAFWIEPIIWFSGIILILVGFIWKLMLPNNQ